MNRIAKVEAQPEVVATNGQRALVIKPPNFQVAQIEIVGTTCLVMNKFSKKAGDQMRRKQEQGDKAKKGTKREPKDFKACYEDAKHRFQGEPDEYGIPACAFRAAMVSACRLCGFVMTRGKLGVFILEDGLDEDGRTGLVRITRGKPKHIEDYVRNDSGVADIRARAMWSAGWRAVVRVSFDADMFSAEDVMNLLARAGAQVGICEGRPDSKNSCGMGWGLFRPLTEEEVSK